MNTEELGVLFGGISAILATLVYSFKHVKESTCCGSKCRQVVLDGNGNAVKSRNSCAMPAELNTAIV